MQVVNINEPGYVDRKKEIVVGIDFGTTNSLVALSQGGEAKIVKMSDGEELVSSIVDMDKTDIVVGQQALKSVNYIRSVKRLLGKSSGEILNNFSLYSISDHLVLDEDLPRFLFNGHTISIPEVAAEIFKYLKYQAEKVLHCTINKAVVSVPAYFDDASRGQVLFAAKIANIDVIRLIAEPTAAAYAYGLNFSTNGTYLVYDLGGGTFDVSVLKMQTGVLQVIATGGHNELGGDDIDIELARYIANKFNKEVTRKLIYIAKECKESLSHSKEFIVIIDNLKLTITKGIFNQIINSFVDETIKIVRDICYNAGHIPLSGIILVGGSTKIPLIQNRLKTIFNLPIYNNLDPGKVVALGAALQAENLSLRSSSSLVIDVLPLSIGLELYGGIVERVIVRNTPIPYSVSKYFTTYADNQKGIIFHVVQGEREMVQNCRSLAYFTLKDIPPMKAGKVRVKVNFAMDVNGILSVTAQEEVTGQAHDIEVRPSFGLTEQEINKILKVAYDNATKDHMERQLTEAKNTAQVLIDQLQNLILDYCNLLPKKKIVEVKRKIAVLQQAMSTYDFNLIVSLTDDLNPIVAQLMQELIDLRLKGKHIDLVIK
jgi:molecular chaperone HscA